MNLPMGTGRRLAQGGEAQQQRRVGWICRGITPCFRSEQPAPGMAIAGGTPCDRSRDAIAMTGADGRASRAARPQVPAVHRRNMETTSAAIHRNCSAIRWRRRESNPAPSPVHTESPASPSTSHCPGKCLFNTAINPSFLRQLSNANDDSTRSMSFSDRPRKASA